MTNAKNRRNMDGRDHYRNDGVYMRQPVQQILWRSMWVRRNNMDILITIAFLTLYYILGLGTVIALKTGIEEEVELEGADYLLAAGFPILLFVIFLDWIARKIVR